MADIETVATRSAHVAVDAIADLDDHRAATGPQTFAGYQPPTGFRESASNVRAPFFLVASTRSPPAMAAKGAGSVINIGSMAGRLGLATGSAYGATKAAVASMTPWPECHECHIQGAR